MKELRSLNYQMACFRFSIYEKANSLQIAITTNPKILIFLQVNNMKLDGLEQSHFQKKYFQS